MECIASETPVLPANSHRCLSTHASVRRHRSLTSLLLDLLEFLLLERGRLREFKVDLVSSKFGISVGHAINLALNEVFVKWVKEDLLVLLSIDIYSDTSSSDVRWEALKDK